MEKKERERDVVTKERERKWTQRNKGEVVRRRIGGGRRERGSEEEEGGREVVRKWI